MDMRGHNLPPMAGNWIAVSRDMRDHPIVGMGQPVPPVDPSRGSYSRYEAWQDLLMEARYRPFEVHNKGKIVTLQRGQLMGARAWLAARWNWSEKTVRVFLAKLESEFMVRSEHGQGEGQPKGQQKGNKVNILTICNYDIYQTILELMQLEGGQQKGQDEGQPRASQGPERNKETSSKEKTGAKQPDGTRIDPDWRLPQEWGREAVHDCKRDREWVVNEAKKFHDYWLSLPDSQGFKKDWKATWRNWCRNALQREAKYARTPAPKKSFQQASDESWFDRQLAEHERGSR